MCFHNILHVRLIARAMCVYQVVDVLRNNVSHTLFIALEYLANNRQYLDTNSHSEDEIEFEEHVETLTLPNASI